MPVSAGLVRDLQVFALILDQARFERRRVSAFDQRRNRPVLLLLERLDFPLALHNQAQGHRLDTPRGDAALHFFPEQRAHLVAYQPVQDTASLLGLHKMGVDAARVLEGLADRVARDLVKDHAIKFHLPGVQEFAQVRADGFPFAVRVCGQVDGVRLAGGSLQFVDDVLLRRDDDVVRLEVLLDVHAQVLLRQVHDVPHRGLHRVAGAEIFIDGFRLGRRFHDDERFSHFPGFQFRVPGPQCRNHSLRMKFFPGN